MQERQLIGHAKTTGPGYANGTYAGGLAPWQTRRLGDYVRDNIQRPLRITDMAAIAGLSPSYFSRAFARCIGAPPHFVLNCYRILLAADMIQNTGGPLAEIAGACGLCDQAHMTRLFQRHLHISPARWRGLGSDGHGFGSVICKALSSDMWLLSVPATIEAVREIVALRGSGFLPSSLGASSSAWSRTDGKPSLTIEFPIGNKERQNAPAGSR